MRTCPSLLSGFSAGVVPPCQHRCPGGHGVSRASRAPLLQVRLHFGSRTCLGLAWILAELAPGAALPQQVPALVERHLGGSQLGVLLVRGQVTRGELGPQLVLGLDELIDVPEDLLLVHATYRTRSARRPRPRPAAAGPPGPAPGPSPGESAA